MEDLEQTSEKKSEQKNLRVETKRFDDFASASAVRESSLKSGSYSKVKIFRRGRTDEYFEVACYVPIEQKKVVKKKK